MNATDYNFFKNLTIYEGKFVKIIRAEGSQAISNIIFYDVT